MGDDDPRQWLALAQRVMNARDRLEGMADGLDLEHWRARVRAADVSIGRRRDLVKLSTRELEGLLFALTTGAPMSGNAEAAERAYRSEVLRLVDCLALMLQVIRAREPYRSDVEAWFRFGRVASEARSHVLLAMQSIDRAEQYRRGVGACDHTDVLGFFGAKLDQAVEAHLDEIHRSRAPGLPVTIARRVVVGMGYAPNVKALAERWKEER